MTVCVGKRHIYLAVVIVNIIGFIEGCMLTWTSPVLPKLLIDDENNPLGRIITLEETAWIGSLHSIGAMFGAVIFGFIFEKLGRKMGGILIMVPYIISFLLGAFGKEVGLFYTARILAGISIGSGECLMPMYIGEAAPKENRGFLATSSIVFITFGCLFSYCVGPFTSIMAFNLILAVFPIITIIGIVIYVPESPYFLLQQKAREESALNALQILRGSNDVDVDKELQSMKEDVSKICDEGSVFEIFKTKAAVKALFIATVLICAHNFSGIYVVLAYTELIFEEAGGHFTSEVSSIIVGVAQFVTVFIAPALVEKMGRKSLLYISMIGLIVNLAAIGAFFFLRDQNVDVSMVTWLPLVAFAIYFIFYNTGIGSIPFTILSEIYPLNVKSTGMAITISLYYISGFLLNFYFYSIVDATGMGQAFWVFAGVSVGTLIFIYACLIETRGKSLQEIQDILAR